jgi:mannose-6-phosphate isomerase-like protein (cupin superfamily)
MRKCILLATLMLTATAASPSAAPAQSSSRATPGAPKNLGSTVYDWAKLAVVPTKTGERRDIVSAPTATLARFETHLTTLRAGEAPHPSHSHPDEEIVIVKEGTLEVAIDGRAEKVGPGSLIFFASNESHGVRNGGDTPVTYYIIRILTPAAANAPAK